MFWWIALFIVLWTAAGVTWFFLNMGKKFRKDQWYDYIMFPPVLIIAIIVGSLYRVRK